MKITFLAAKGNWGKANTVPLGALGLGGPDIKFLSINIYIYVL